MKLDTDIELLRFVTAGSVDDGKSTLIGRLLYDSKTIMEDQLKAVERSSKKKGLEHVDLSLLTDGLKAEREQGITIDVAYRYFTTPKRKFIIADCPGHVQYTRNMVTGASTANLALLLIDARNGVVEQTKRHAFIASLLQIPHLVLCVNKMDLVNFSEERYNDIVREFRNFSVKLQCKDIRFVPISALEGDNVVDRSKRMEWYNGPTLIDLLETIHISSDSDLIDCRFPVQTVIRPHKEAFHDYRGYAGRVEGGIFKKGDEVVGSETRVKVVKNKVAAPFTDAEFDIIYNEGISSVGSLIDLAQEFDIIQKRGSWFSYDGAQLGQGRDATKAALLEDGDLYREIEEKVKEKMNGE
jgi:sulfate adenylyltransferase subunit 1